MRPLKILIADDHALMLEAIKLALADASDFEIVGQADSGSQLLPLVNQTEPDLVLLDLAMPGVDGITCIKLLRKRYPWVRTIVLSGHDSDDVVEAALDAGADAFIVKSVDPAGLAAALRDALDSPVAKAIGRANGAHPAVEERGLSERELDVLHALAEGKSNKEIAAQLDLSVNTVAVHRANIMDALGIHKTAELVVYAIRNGLVNIP
jgi:DNA-binding NarL/FixJ family response regulator